MGLTKLSPHSFGMEKTKKTWRLFILVRTEMPACAGVLVGEDGTDGAMHSREAVGSQLLTNPLEQPYLTSLAYQQLGWQTTAHITTVSAWQRFFTATMVHTS